MAFCNNCGEQLQDGKKFCAVCGQPVAAGSGQRQQHYQQGQQSAERLIGAFQNTADETGGYNQADIEKNKTMGGLAYFLFFLPLLACPDSKYGRFHANQGLIYLFLCMAGGVISTFLALILTWRLYWFTTVLTFVIWIPILIIGVIGLINGFTGKAKELPLIGRFRIIQ